MKKKFIITGIGASLLLTGIIGGIWSGVSAVPAFVNKAQIERAKYDKKEILFDKEIDIKKLNAVFSKSSVQIKRHDSPKVLIERRGDKDDTTPVIKENGNELTLVEELSDNKPIVNVKNIDDIVKLFLNEAFRPSLSEITIYIPSNIDVNITTALGDLSILDDNMQFNNLEFITTSGRIFMDPNVSIGNLNIKSSTEITLSVGEMANIKNINLDGETVYIHSGGEDVFVDNLDEKLPESIKITSSNADYGYINIETSRPIAKNLDISSLGQTNLTLPLLNYKFNFNMKASSGINFDELKNQEKYYNTSIAKYFNDDNYSDIDNENTRKVFEGFMNEEFSPETSVYNINVKSDSINMQ